MISKCNDFQCIYNETHHKLTKKSMLLRGRAHVQAKCARFPSKMKGGCDIMFGCDIIRSL